MSPNESLADRKQRLEDDFHGYQLSIRNCEFEFIQSQKIKEKLENEVKQYEAMTSSLLSAIHDAKYGADDANYLQRLNATFER